MADGTEVGTAYVSIVPSAAKFGSALQSQITGQAATAGVAAGQALGAGVTSGAGGLVKGLAGIFATAGTFQFLQGAVQDADEAVRVGQLTEAVIRSTGGAANVSAAQVETLAESLSKVARVDNTLIQAGANVLLSFRAVRNEFGAGNDIFNQAAAAALNMSAALGGDLQSSIMQLGKALQDPTQGLTALRRSGVLFTDGQQDMIEALVASGDLLEAQKIILGQIEAQFGGAAAAAVTDLDKLSVVIGDFSERVGSAMLPGVEAAAGALGGLLNSFESLPGGTKGAVSALFVVGGAATAAALGVGLLAPKVREARIELASMGSAGALASRSLGWLAKGGVVIGGAFALAQGLQAVFNKVVDLTGGGVGSVDKLTNDIAEFATTGGKVVGELADQFERDLSGIGDKLSTFEQSQGLFGAAQRVLDPDFGAAREDLDSLDKTLAALVGSGHGEAAAEFFTRIKEEGRGAGVSVKDTTGVFDDYSDALAAAGAQAKLTGDASSGAVPGVLALGDAAEITAEDIKAAVLGLTGAERARDDAVRAVIASEADLADSHRELNQLIAAGAVDEERVADARRSLAEATRSAAGADRDLADAQKAYDEAVVGLDVLHGFDTAQDAVADAAGNLADAQDSAASAHARAAEAAADLREAQAGDPEFQDRLAEARGRVADATQGVADANFDLAQRAYDLDEATKLSNTSLATNAGLVAGIRTEWETLLGLSPEVAAFLSGPLSLLGPAPPGPDLRPLVGGGTPAPGTWAAADAAATAATTTTNNKNVTINVTQTDPDPKVLAHEISWALIP